MIYKLADIFKNFEKNLHRIYQTIVSVFKIIILSRFNVKLPGYSGKNCYILGNGPSLKESIKQFDLLFSQSDLVCVNNFAISEEFIRYKPVHYVLLDPNFFSKTGYKKYSVINNTFEKIIHETTWKMNLFVPQLAKGADKLKEIKEKNNNINIIYFNYTIVQGFNKLAFLFYTMNLGMPLCQNVLGACIFLALNMGYKKIYIFGADHSWIQNLRVSEDNELYMNHVHFYSQESKPVITKIYRSQDSCEKMTISEYFYSKYKTFNVYYILEEYSKSLGSKIFNASDFSYIDAFERKKPGLPS